MLDSPLVLTVVKLLLAIVSGFFMWDAGTLAEGTDLLIGLISLIGAIITFVRENNLFSRKEAEIKTLHVRHAELLAENRALKAA